MNRYFIRGFWSAREESRREVAVRVATFLQELIPFPRELSTFFKGQWTRKTPLKQLPTTANEVESFLGQWYTSFEPRQLMPELGFRLTAWNGLPDESRVAKLRVHCGAYGAHVGNGITLEFNCIEPAENQVLRQLMQGVVSAFDPDQAVAKWCVDRADHPDMDCFTYDRANGLQSRLT